MTSLGLGTAQFGFDYGVTNSRGRVPLNEVAGILGLADKVGIHYLDTASLYGVSESVLGQCGAAHFRIITKTPRFGFPRIKLAHANELLEAFSRSLANLNVLRVYALLVHHAPDLLASGGDLLMSSMRALRQQGVVTKIGASVYNGSEIDALLDRYQDIDLIQLPINAIDQRLIHGGHIRRLKARGVEIHARSIFLQGLLLAPSMNASSNLERLTPYLKRWEASVATAGLTYLQAALGFIRTIPEIDTIIVGVTEGDELAQIAYAFEHANPFPAEGVACNDPDIIDPSRWDKGNDSPAKTPGVGK